ncbi:MAG: inorganic phosphate transporter [bacterium]|nr:inorganic phosphate transporter [bacterium]MDT8366744.1 inorganic phosphate transporter [bacterium]
MLGLEAWVFWVAIAACGYMAWNIGANDVANAMGTSVGSHAITMKQAVLLAAVFEFAGAFLVGGHVTNTVRKGIVSTEVFQSSPEVFVLGMLSALLAAGVWLNLATFLGLPVSTTHSIIGSIVGFGLLVGGVSAIHWGKLLSVVMSWVISPLCGGLMGWATFTFIKRTVLTSWNPVRAARKIVPILIFPVATILVLSMLYKGLKNLKLDVPFNQALVIALLVGVLAHFAMRIILAYKLKDIPRKRTDAFVQVEKIFAYLQIGTACYVAFAHGANDVANAIGPFAAIVSVFKSGDLAMKVPVPLWVLALGGAGIVVGLGTWGYKVIETIGKKITSMTPSRGFSAEFATATTVLVCSKLGLPVSTSHTLVGSVIGVGLARGMAALNLRVIRSIVNSWIITIPAAGILTILIYLALKAVAP